MIGGEHDFRQASLVAVRQVPRVGYEAGQGKVGRYLNNENETVP
jgi:hypothetical protein